VELERYIPFGAMSIFSVSSSVTPRPEEDVNYNNGNHPPFCIHDIRLESLNCQRLFSFYAKMGLKDMKRRLEGRLAKLNTYNEEKISSMENLMVNSSFSRRKFQEAPSTSDYKDVPF